MNLVPAIYRRQFDETHLTQAKQESPTYLAAQSARSALGEFAEIFSRGVTQRISEGSSLDNGAPVHLFRDLYNFLDTPASCCGVCLRRNEREKERRRIDPGGGNRLSPAGTDTIHNRTRNAEKTQSTPIQTHKLAREESKDSARRQEKCPRYNKRSIRIVSTAGSGKYPRQESVRRDEGQVSAGRGSEGGVRSEVEALCGMELRQWCVRMLPQQRRAEQDARHRHRDPTHAHPAPHPHPIPTPSGRAVLLVDGGSEELAGAVVKAAVLEADPDTEDAETEAEVDDGTNDGESEVGFVAAAQNCSTSASAEGTSSGQEVFALRAEEVKRNRGEEMHRATQKQLTATSEEQFAAAMASPTQFATRPMHRRNPSKLQLELVRVNPDGAMHRPGPPSAASASACSKPPPESLNAWEPSTRPVVVAPTLSNWWDMQALPYGRYMVDFADLQARNNPVGPDQVL
ncbi:hypothetical protein FB451DRAFT_1433296 [Mycena latifolia]|nr:hypothetical protein FB451DRAFT_1433296 [Mycena latifolia]